MIRSVIRKVRHPDPRRVAAPSRGGGPPRGQRGPGGRGRLGPQGDPPAWPRVGKSGTIRAGRPGPTGPRSTGASPDRMNFGPPTGKRPRSGDVDGARRRSREGMPGQFDGCVARPEGSFSQGAGIRRVRRRRRQLECGRRGSSETAVARDERIGRGCRGLNWPRFSGERIGAGLSEGEQAKVFSRANRGGAVEAELAKAFRRANRGGAVGGRTGQGFQSSESSVARVERTRPRVERTSSHGSAFTRYWVTTRSVSRKVRHPDSGSQGARYPRRPPNHVRSRSGSSRPSAPGPPSRSGRPTPCRRRPVRCARRS